MANGDAQVAASDAAVPNGTEEQPAADQQEAYVDPKLEEFEKEFKKAQEDPADFNQWIAVEKLVDKLVGCSSKTPLHFKSSEAEAKAQIASKLRSRASYELSIQTWCF